MKVQIFRFSRQKSAKCKYRIDIILTGKMSIIFKLFNRKMRSVIELYIKLDKIMSLFSKNIARG